MVSKLTIAVSVWLIGLSSAFGLDLNKTSDVKQQQIYEENLFKKITKESLLDMLCKKADDISKAQAKERGDVASTAMLRKARGDFESIVMLRFSVIDGQICIGNFVHTPEPELCKKQVIPIGDGILTNAFFNSYGRGLETKKECQDVPLRLKGGFSAIGKYHVHRSSSYERDALQQMEGVRQLPKACREQTLDFLEYANKRLGECIK